MATLSPIDHAEAIADDTATIDYPVVNSRQAMIFHCQSHALQFNSLRARRRSRPHALSADGTTLLPPPPPASTTSPELADHHHQPRAHGISSPTLVGYAQYSTTMLLYEMLHPSEPLETACATYCLPTCERNRMDDGSMMIACDACDQWYHPGCVGAPPPDPPARFVEIR